MANIVSRKLTENFSYGEFFKSHTAVRRSLPVYPSSLADGIIVFSNIHKLATILQLVRALYCRPITITSGYRSRALNDAVGGVKNSKHIFGAAADIVSDDMESLGQCLEKIRAATYFASEKSYLFRIVKEQVKNGVPTWYHIQLEPCCDKMTDEYFYHLFI